MDNLALRLEALKMADARAQGANGAFRDVESVLDEAEKYYLFLAGLDACPDVFDFVDKNKVISAIKEAQADGRVFWLDARSSNGWIGDIIASQGMINIDTRRGRLRVQRIVELLIKEGHLPKVSLSDDKRHTKTAVVVNQRPEQSSLHSS